MKRTALIFGAVLFIGLIIHSIYNGELSKFNNLEKYEKAGINCKSIDEVIERGDCFQEIHSQYLIWTLNESKQSFYFPFQDDQDHWQDMLYATIDEQDHLDGFHKTEYYVNYLLGDTDSELKEQKGKDMLEKYWHVFSGFFPQEYRMYLKYIYWTDTGEDAVLGVGRDEGDVQKTLLMISRNVESYHPRVKNTLIHEFGHVLTLSQDQLELENDGMTIGCPTLYDSTIDCVNETSYLKQFYNQFWSDIVDDYDQIDWSDGVDYQVFFSEHEEYFFNSYQGSDPIEDIAEAFTFFVMMDSSVTDGKLEQKYKKVLFFYQYEELVELRTMILENVYDLSVADGILY